MVTVEYTTITKTLTSSKGVEYIEVVPVKITTFNGGKNSFDVKVEVI